METMELDDHGFLEELLALRREAWDTFPSGMADIFPSECFDDAANPAAISSVEPLLVGGGGGGGGSGTSNSISTVMPAQQIPIIPYSCNFANGFREEMGFVNGGDSGMFCKVEVSQLQQQQSGVAATAMVSSSSTSSCCTERKMRVRKAEGQPSKNLMAERRRRKRLNDRLSMLRSVVPKISKMDRTSILGDTIDYMKELLERIKGLQEEIEVTGVNNSDENQHHRGNLLGIFKDVSPNEILVRNTPQFDVERRELDTRVDICCAGKPGLLLSTVSTLEALGLEIQQCVVSCFNDFGMQASCSEDMEQRAVISAEEIKQALFRNAGYGGRCM